MKLSLNLIESDSVIRSKILNSIRDAMDQSMKICLNKIKNKIPLEVKDALISEPEYLSLVGGKLKYEMGIPAKSYVDNIIDIWISNIVVSYTGLTVGPQGVKGSIKLDMIKSSYEDVLSGDGAVIMDSVSGAALPWLEWLLLYGGKIIVRNYRVQFGPNNRSRTGMAIMVESNNSNWRVPPEFAGTSNNNWATRALQRVDNKILNILQEEFEASI